MVISNRVFVTGVGIISPIGLNLVENWNNLLLGINKCHKLSDCYSSFPCQIGCVISENEMDKVNSFLTISDRKSMSRSAKLVSFAANEALGHKNIEILDKYRCGVSIGIGFDGAFDGGYDANVKYSKVGPYALTKALGNMPAAHLSIQYKFHGPSRSVNTACAASLHAIGDAFHLIRKGECDLMLAGGTEAAINPWIIAAFSRIRALSAKCNDIPHLASRPFDVNRSGFVMSEGAAILVLESEASYLRNNTSETPLAEIIGFSQTCDAVNLVAPDSNGDGAIRCMAAALKDANIVTDEVDYINAHATSTPQGDLAECKAISKLFGTVKKECSPIVSSFKGQLGHCLGGAGALETVLVIKALSEGIIPPNGNLEYLDPDIEATGVKIASGNKGIRLSESGTKSQRIAVKNSFGFGGTNCSLVIRQER